MRPKYATSNFVHLGIKKTFHRLASVSAHFDFFCLYTHTLPVSGGVGHIYIAV